MALRRALSLRSLFRAHHYQPSCSSIIIRRDIVENPNHHSSLNQRSSYSSSILSQHLRSCSKFSLCNPLGVSAGRSMSTSRIPGSDVKKESVLQDVASQTTTLTRIVDAAQQLVDRVHSFTGLNWWVCLVFLVHLIPLVALLLITIPMFSRIAIRYLIMQMLSILMGVYLAIKYQGGDQSVFAQSQREYDDLVKEYGHSTSAFSFARAFLQPWLFACLGITEKEASFTTGTDNTSQDALRIFRFETLFHCLIVAECVGVAALVGLKTLVKKYPTTQLAALIASQPLTIPVVLLGMVLSKMAHWHFKSCTTFSLASLYFLLWCARVRKHRECDCKCSSNGISVLGVETKDLHIRDS